MGECKLDHSRDDVLKKLGEQAPYLDDTLVSQLQHYLQAERSQEELNRLFHLLKKYDLADQEEQARRREELAALLNSPNDDCQRSLA